MDYSPAVLKLLPENLTITPHSNLFLELRLSSAAAITSIVYPVANLAIYMPLLIGNDYLANQVFWYNGTLSGTPTVDLGVYDSLGNLLYHTGAIAQTSSSSLQVTAISGGLFLPRGRYYLGIVVASNLTALFAATMSAVYTNTTKILGVGEQALGGSVLPNPAVFAAATHNYVPVCGISMNPLVI